MTESSNVSAFKKLIILYIADKYASPVSNSQISQLVIEKNYMDYFLLQAYLSELVATGLLVLENSKNISYYTITSQGKETLMYFNAQIHQYIKNEIKEYISNNEGKKNIDYEISANYFQTINNDYLVKCGVYDYDGATILEVNLAVANKEQATKVCSNWKNNINTLYGNIFTNLIEMKS